MLSFVLDVFGTRKMSTIYGAVLTAWAAAGIFGPLYVGYLKDMYPDRAVLYCFLIGILMLGAGYLFSYLLNDGGFAWAVRRSKARFSGMGFRWRRRADPHAGNPWYRRGRARVSLDRSSTVADNPDVHPIILNLSAPRCTEK